MTTTTTTTTTAAEILSSVLIERASLLVHIDALLASTLATDKALRDALTAARNKLLTLPIKSPDELARDVAARHLTVEATA